MDKKRLENALFRSLQWFENSGIMKPSDGSWGVAERYFTGKEEAQRQRVINAFNSYTQRGDAMVVESRRPDCNFQLAWLELCSGEIFCNKHFTELSQTLVEYLYCRSGMLSRGFSSALAPVGVWNWSHTQWHCKVFFDDNSWCLMLGCLIAARQPDWAEQHQMGTYNAALAKALCDGLERCLNTGEPIVSEDSYDPQNTWWGRIYMPHFCALVSAALSVAAAYIDGADNAEKMHKLVRRYMKFVESAIDTFNSSELSYALLGASVVWSLEEDKAFYGSLAERLAEKLMSRMDPATGNLPAEHNESPLGANLVDLIYTVNWALLALQQYAAVSGDSKARAAFEKLLNLVLDLQDASGDSRFDGCWRGMYDLASRQWGGGFAIEGGDQSIYSGWTNAPIALAIAGELMNRPLIVKP